MEKILKKYIKDEKIVKIVDYCITAILCVAVFFGVRAFVGVPIQADGVSMTPTIDNNDMVLVNRLSYIFTSPKKGDVIIFPYGDNEMYIKRIIGMPGDEILIENGKIYINGDVYEDEFESQLTAYGDREYPIIVEEDTYYVLGDNRKVSRDSRYSSVGEIHKDEIIGKALLIYIPFENFGFIK